MCIRDRCEKKQCGDSEAAYEHEELAPTAFAQKINGEHHADDSDELVADIVARDHERREPSGTVKAGGVQAPGQRKIPPHEWTVVHEVIGQNAKNQSADEEHRQSCLLYTS